MKKNCLLVLLLFLFAGCTSKSLQRPNVILIMADDMGYECLSANGSLSYSTPILDHLAGEGMRFTNCISQPLCTPSRVKIMTGKYNFRNYEYFTYLNENQKTFGQVMKEAGYATCITGKWQLNGLKYKLPGFDDNSRPHQMGFDSYCLWQLSKEKRYGERYANPLIEQNGSILQCKEEDYGPDIFSSFACDFIEQNAGKPFFIYYPMVLVHNPFVATPGSKEWNVKEKRFKNDPAFFKDMVEYTDKIVGKIVNKLKAEKLLDNTILIFTADNGTNRTITTQTTGGEVVGFKGNTTPAGVNVPLVISWPGKMKKGKVSDALIGFNDFFATLAEIAGADAPSDGKSFYNLIRGEAYEERDAVMVHYDPRWSKGVNKYRNRFAQTKQYKLYQDGRFFDLQNDRLEQNSIARQEMTDEMVEAGRVLQRLLDKAPAWE